MLENKLHFHIFRDGSPSLILRELYCHRHREAVFCVSQGGAGVQGTTAGKISKEQQNAKIQILSLLLGIKITSRLINSMYDLAVYNIPSDISYPTKI